MATTAKPLPPLLVQCDCGQKYRAKPGARFGCKKCRATVLVPTGAAPPMPVAPPAYTYAMALPAAPAPPVPRAERRSRRPAKRRKPVESFDASRPMGMLATACVVILVILRALGHILNAAYGE